MARPRQKQSSGVLAATATDADRIRRLCRWFDGNARDLPWRRHRDGYGALVSEAMLQQTQVTRVVDRYEAFLERFPSVHDLASADEQAVLAAWQGLGYYRRARHLHAAAKAIVADHAGRVPADVGDLMRLSGVGRYTAGAIASIVFEQPAPIVDGNVRRVLARWDAHREPPAASGTPAWAWARATQLVEKADRPGAFNEGLMELGATVCTPKSPGCGGCPVAGACEARKRGLQEVIPPPRSGPDRLVVHHHAVVLERGGRVLFVQRPARGLWADMWQPPTVESDRRLSDNEIISGLVVRASSMKHIETFEHQTTHRRVVFHVFAGRTRARRGQWRDPADMDDLPMSNAHRKVLQAAWGQAGR